ncbi:hypothetical protein CAS74_004525 [Pichia kudriavzevii]|nr:hypothetical protein JL09_g1849 [Pichia kudriavzevii]ONH71851.1 hypothetical protein BOH78_4206 [Pichia kudriavzevii]OUT20278.1 hypothetical protein CAS74_004525 [Pichia kudriavzevii]
MDSVHERLATLRAIKQLEENTNDEKRLQKFRILAMLKQMKTVPISTTISPTISSSLALVKSQQLEKSASIPFHDQLETQLEFQKGLAAQLDQLLDKLNRQLSNHVEDEIIDNDTLISKMDALKSKSKRLSSYIRLVVDEYLFDKEFVHLFSKLDDEAVKSRRQKFLRLLEALLNNNIVNPNSGEAKYITLQSIDDPLVRFLILNRLVVVHPKFQNKITLRDLSHDI